MKLKKRDYASSKRDMKSFSDMASARNSDMYGVYPKHSVSSLGEVGLKQEGRRSVKNEDAAPGDHAGADDLGAGGVGAGARPSSSSSGDGDTEDYYNPTIYDSPQKSQLGRD